MSFGEDDDNKAVGFYNGTQSVSTDPEMQSLSPKFEAKEAKCRRKAEAKLSRQRARVAILVVLIEAAQKSKELVETRLGESCPAFFLPLIALAAAIFTVAGETAFLAPVVDALGVGARNQQILLSLTIVLSASGLMKILVNRYQAIAEEPAKTDESREAKSLRFAIICLLTLLTLITLTVLGLWRADELFFEASRSSQLANFLKLNPRLSRLVITLLTLALPVFASIAADYGFGQLSKCYCWQRAHLAHKFALRRLNFAETRVEASEQKLKHKLDQIQAERRQALADYRQSHELGVRLGAKRLPLGILIVRIASCAMLVVLVCLLSDGFVAQWVSSDAKRNLLYFAATLMATGRYAAYAFMVYDRPNARQLYKQRALRWRGESFDDLQLSRGSQLTYSPFNQVGARLRSLALNRVRSGRAALGLLAILSLAIGTVGCGADAPKAQLIVCVVDPTGSIEAASQEEAISAVQDGIFKRSEQKGEYFNYLRRGDAVAVLPITGDAQAYGQGRTLRFPLSPHRVPMDGDLDQLSMELPARLQSLWADSERQQYQKSDLLNTMRLVAEEFSHANQTEHRRLIILSDFIEDNGRLNFNSDERLADAAKARVFGQELAGAVLPDHKSAFQGAQIYLGLLRSKDLRKLSSDRRDAILEFWLAYFRELGAGKINVATDGSGLLPRFMSQMARNQEPSGE